MTKPPQQDDTIEPHGASPRMVGDDFYCLRYSLWYASRDCAYRTFHATAPGCARCDQGRFNLQRHSRTLLRIEAVQRARGR